MDAAWPLNEVDRFIRSEQEAHDIQPNPEASPAQQLRRLSFDLTGLPPDPDTLAAFERDPSEAHYRRLVESMLASQAFGETWGRHWLDLARYAESTGGGRSSVLANAWRYRNYVIGAFNDDMPYGQFITEQIAGDLLPHTSAAARERQLVATAFLALGPKNLDLQDKELLRMNTVDEQIETIGRSMLGMTISCARCHAHKFDPIPMEDYYAMAGILRSTRTLVLGNVSSLVEQELPVAKERKEAYQAHVAASKQLEAAIKKAKARKEPSPEEKQELADLQAKLKALKEAVVAPLPKAISVHDETKAEDYALSIRGNSSVSWASVGWPEAFSRSRFPRAIWRLPLPSSEWSPGAGPVGPSDPSQPPGCQGACESHCGIITKLPMSRAGARWWDHG